MSNNTMKKLLFSFLLILSLSISTAGCAAVLRALPTVLEIITQSTLVLDQIEDWAGAYFAGNPDPEFEAKVRRGLAVTRGALATAQASTRGAQQLEQHQVDAAFEDFKRAYRELTNMVAPLGVAVGPAPDDAPLSASSRTLHVPDADALLAVSR